LRLLFFRSLYSSILLFAFLLHSYVQLKLSATPLAVAAIGEFILPHAPLTGKNVVLEFSSPNTNKPQHLGHVRNNCLGTAVANLLTSQGDKVTKIALLNNRGVHICKSMVAYKYYGEGTSWSRFGLEL
jgi:arginyl-tRNA synthetase